MINLECWQDDPNSRPDIQQVVSTLQQLKSSQMLSEDNNAIKWIKDALKNKTVNSIPFNQLKNSEPINKGGFGCIMKAIWTKTNNYVVYKKLTNTAAIKHDTLNAFIHELQIHLHLDYSDRIVRCLGISQGNLNIYMKL